MKPASREVGAPAQTVSRPRGAWAQRALLGGLVTAAPVFVAVLLIDMFAPAWIGRLAFTTVVAICVVVGLQVFMGNARIVNFAHTVFVALGAYSVAILSADPVMKAIIIPNAPLGLVTFSVSPLVAALIGLVVVGTVALVTGIFIVRVTGIAADILTLCMQIIFHGIFINWTNLFKGNTAFFGIPQVMTLPLGAAICSAIIVIARVFKDSPLGLHLRASAENLLAAQSSGVRVARVRLAGWVLGAMIAGVAGMIFALFVGTITARAFYFSYVFLTLAMLILGGMRSVTGAVVGVLIIEIGIELIRTLENGPTILWTKLPQMFGLSGMMLGLVIVLCMAFRPQGLMGTLELDDLLLRAKRAAGKRDEV